MVAIGRNGDFRRLGVPGEDLDKVANRLHDPADFAGQRTAGGGGRGQRPGDGRRPGPGRGPGDPVLPGPGVSRPKPENVEAVEALAAGGGVPEARARVERPGSGRVTTAAGDFLGEAPATGRSTSCWGAG